jgi:hypothetical protein|tara:strand:- start:132 stop:284 length:153 start_codon:yes stop_codon:yes gene_type:complete
MRYIGVIIILGEPESRELLETENGTSQIFTYSNMIVYSENTKVTAIQRFD